MKNKHNSFFKNNAKRPSSLIKFKKPSFNINNKLVKKNSKFNSPDIEQENIQKNQFSFFSIFTPIFNKKKSKDSNNNQTVKNQLILTSLDYFPVNKKNDKIFPYEYNSNNNINNITKKNVHRANNNNYLNNVSFANLLNVKRAKNQKKSKKKINNKTPDSKLNNNNIISSKLNSEKRNNQRKKNYFLTSLRSKKSSRGKSEKNKEKEKNIDNLMKKLNILNLKKLPKPYNSKVECLSFKGSSHNYKQSLPWCEANILTKRKKSRIRYGINHFMDYLRGANNFKYGKNSINKNISISSLSNISFKKIISNNNTNNKQNKNINKLKLPNNPNYSSTTPTLNLPLNKKSIVAVKNFNLFHRKKNKKINSIEHKKTKSINFGPISNPCFNCFFNIINENGNNNIINNNNIKSKINDITIDMNYGKTKKNNNIIFFCDKNGTKQKCNDNNNNIKKNNNNVISNYFININNQIENNNLKKNIKNNNNINIFHQKSNKVSQSQAELLPIQKSKKQKNFTSKNTPTKMLSQRLSTENNKIKKNNHKKKQQKKEQKEKSEINSYINTSQSKIEEYNYYKDQSIKLSNYIKNYYKKNKKYPNTRINFYKYGRLIGQGAFGKVNIGLNILTGRVVAVKSFIKSELKTNQNFSKILYETNLMQKLNHPNITKILETFEDDKYIFIIMEYINGGNLFSFVKKRRKLSEKISKFLFKQIILGIQHIHSKKIVHRDIKLENILIDLNNKIKICDFGIGIMLESENELIYDQCGTPMYMAPEIILNSKKKGYKGYPVDIWSAGIALYIMLSGTLPFCYKNNKNNDNNSISLSNSSNNNNYELQYSIINKNPKKIKKISNEAKDLLRGLLNKEPDKRLTIEQILNHPWFKIDEDKSNKYNLFTKAERIMLSKNYIDYRKEGNEDLKESFSISNLNSNEKDDINIKNVKTKSSILAPYNTLIENESFRINSKGEVEFDNGEKFNDFHNPKIKLENDIVNIGHKVKNAFINFEFNNNGELDNGMVIQSKSRSNTFINLSEDENELSENDNNKNESDENDVELNKENKEKKILEIIEDFGYDKNYTKSCVENNVLCHCSTVYYLLMNYGDF